MQNKKPARKSPGKSATRLLTRLLLLASVCTQAGGARGEADEYETSHLSGGWGGKRQELVYRGWLWEIGYRADFMAVTEGGQGRGGRPATHLDVKLRADLEKIADWHGATAFFNLLDNRGGRPGADHLGSLLGTSNIEVPNPTHRLFHAWFQKEWADGQLSLLFGLYPIDSEFMVTDSSGLFVQPAYGALADLAFSRGPSIFNNSAVGLRAKWVSPDRSLYAQGALLDGVPGSPNHAVGTHVRFGQGDGTMGIMEFGFRPPLAKALPEPMATEAGAGEPEAQAAEPGEEFGKYSLGFWRYSARSDDLLDVDGDGNPLRRRSQGWYGLAEKTVLPGSPVGDVALFARYSQNDGHSIPVSRAVNVGVNFKGPLPGRESDAAGIGFTRGAVSSKYRAVLEQDGITAAKAEKAWEVTYRIQANPWLALQPVVQIFQYPGADRSRNARVMGLRVDLAL